MPPISEPTPPQAPLPPTPQAFPTLPVALGGVVVLLIALAIAAWMFYEAPSRAKPQLNEPSTNPSNPMNTSSDQPVPAPTANTTANDSKNLDSTDKTKMESAASTFLAVLKSRDVAAIRTAYVATVSPSDRPDFATYSDTDVLALSDYTVTLYEALLGAWNDPNKGEITTTEYAPGKVLVYLQSSSGDTSIAAKFYFARSGDGWEVSYPTE